MEIFVHALPDIAATGWPDEWSDDWFVCDGAGGVDGPLPAAMIFAVKNQDFALRQGAESGKRFVSRRGFAQWYDAEDFAGLWSAAANLASLTSLAAQAMEMPEVASVMEMPLVALAMNADDDILQALVMSGVNPSALAAPVGCLVPMAAFVPETAIAISPRIESAMQLAQQAGQVQSPVEPRMAWLAQRAKSRLGNLCNPVSPAFLTTVSCGVYYTAWLLGAMREVVWHMDHDTLVRRHVASPWMAWVPGLHIKATWDLACLIRAMEEQDGYTATRPVTAAMLAIVPPFAAAYLQHALNDHWLIHCLDPR